MLDANEAINLLSRVRLGVSLGLLESTSIQEVHRLLLHVQPAHLSALKNVALEDDESTRVARASLVRGMLAGD